MDTIGVGIIGWGFMGQTHTHALRSIPLFYPNIGWKPELRSVCSRRLDKAREAADMLGFAHYTDDYRELLARDDVQVVSVCTPNELHEEMVIAAVRAGKHVYIDKPLTTDYASAMRIMEACKGGSSLTQMVLHNRFFPSAMRAKELIEQGRIGEVISFQCRYLHSGSIDSNKPMGWKQGASAGVLQDLGSHALDMVTWLMGYPKEVFCTLRQLYAQRPMRDGKMESALGDDQALMLLRMDNGALGTVEASKISTGTEDELTLEIYGTRGALRMQPMRQGYLEFFDNAQPDVPLGGERGYVSIACNARFPAPGGTFLPPKNAIGWDRAHIHCYYSFLDCVVHGKTPSPTLQDGAKLQMLMQRMVDSDAARSWMDVDFIEAE